MDESEDEEATIGAGELVTGWELGLAGACEGERRRIMMNHDMAYGEAGARLHIVQAKIDSVRKKIPSTLAEQITFTHFNIGNSPG